VNVNTEALDSQHYQIMAMLIVEYTLCSKKNMWPLFWW